MRMFQVTIWHLATGADYRTLQELFGLGMSTACTIFIETITAIVHTLKKKFVHFPSAEEYQQISRVFLDDWDFPMCVGALDSTHIPIIAPSDSHNDYYNRKCFYSIILQGVCDNSGLFWNVDIGFPGKAHDSRVLSNSTLFDQAENGQLFPPVTQNIHGRDILYVLVGDAAYPLKTWLMKPFRENINTPGDEKNFNYRLSRARIIIECAFGKLKGRWRALMKRCDSHVSIMPTVVMACVILHNICEHRGEDFDFPDVDTDGMQEPDPHEAVQGRRDEDMQGAIHIRNALKAHFNANRL